MLTFLPYMPSSVVCSPSIHVHLSVPYMPSSAVCSQSIPAHLSTLHAFIFCLLSKHSCSPYYLTCLHLPCAPPSIHAHLSTFHAFICRLLPKHSCSPFYLTCLYLPSAPQGFMLTFLPYMPSSAVCSSSIHSPLSTFQAFICRLLPKHSFSPFYLTCLHLPSVPLAFILPFLPSLPSSAVCSPSIHVQLSVPYMPSSAVCSPTMHSHLSTFHATHSFLISDPSMTPFFLPFFSFLS
jgi:hypothetical protein